MRREVGLRTSSFYSHSHKRNDLRSHKIVHAKLCIYPLASHHETQLTTQHLSVIWLAGRDQNYYQSLRAFFMRSKVQQVYIVRNPLWGSWLCFKWKQISYRWNQSWYRDSRCILPALRRTLNTLTMQGSHRRLIRWQVILVSGVQQATNGLHQPLNRKSMLTTADIVERCIATQTQLKLRKVTSQFIIINELTK